MNILFVIGSLVYGGAETQVMALAKALVLKGHYVTIYSTTDRVPRIRELEGSGVVVVVGSKRYECDIKMIRRLRQYIDNNDIDIVQGFLFEGDFYSRLATVGKRIPLINSERNWNYILPFIQKIGHILTRPRVDYLIANSKSGLDFAAKRYKLNDNKMFTVWNGLDLYGIDKRIEESTKEYKKEFFQNDSIKLACFVGSIKWKKDVLFALDVASRLVEANPDWRVVFLGDKLEGTHGQYVNKVMKKYSTLPLQDRILFEGNRDDAVEIMAQSDVLFSTSLIEGFPNVVLEAMAVNTPVVSTNYSDIILILDQEQIEMEREPSEYVARLLRVHGREDAIIPRQRAFVEDNCDITKIVAQYEDIYTKCIASV